MNPQEIESNYRKPWISVRSVLNLYPDRKDERRDEYWYRLGEVSYWEDSDWDDDGNVIDSVEIISDYAFFSPFGISWYSIASSVRGAAILAATGVYFLWFSHL